MDNQENYKNPYKVPEGYFDGLYTDILEKKANEPIVKRIYLRPYWSPKVLIPITAIAICAVLLISRTEPVFNAADCKSLSCLDDTELLDAATELDASTLLDYADYNSADSEITNEFDLQEIDESQLLNEL